MKSEAKEIFYINQERIQIQLKQAAKLAAVLDLVRMEFEALELPAAFTIKDLDILLKWGTDVPAYVREIAFPAIKKGKVSVQVPAGEILGLERLILQVQQARIACLHNFPVSSFGLLDGRVVFLATDEIQAQNTVYANTDQEKALLEDTRALFYALSEYLTAYPNIRFNDVFNIARNVVTLNTRNLPSMLIGARAPIAKKKYAKTK